MEQHVTEILPPGEFLPAVGQGALGLETRIDDKIITELLAGINHHPTWTSIIAERAFMRKLEGGCLVPVGCFTVLDQQDLTITGFVSSTDGREYLEEKLTGNPSDPGKLGTMLAERLIGRGGDKILRQIRNK
jgi:hydroxymethylbilane synthase